MAQVPPPIAPPGVPPPTRPKRRGCLGCGLGCLIPVVLIVLLLVGGFYFLVVQAAASVSVPAQLVVLNPATTLVHGGSAQPATSGAQVHENDQVRTDANGRSLIQFQDGSITRLAPSTQITLTSAQFDSKGRLAKVGIGQQAGRTMNTVEKLVAGNASFTVSGHSANASVRGTKFEVVQFANGGVLLKTYIGRVHLAGSNGSGADVNAGQQASAAPNGAVSPPVPIAPDPNDPFTLWMASEEGAKAAGQPATAQTSFNNGGLGTGQTQAQPDYSTAGGEVIGELAYPGSNMRLTITDPNGVPHQNSGGSVTRNGKLVVVDIPNAPGGVFKISVTGVDVNPSENFTVTLVTKFVCSANQLAGGGYVRNVLSANDTKNTLVQAGATNVNISFNGASAGGANVSGSGNFSGTNLAGAALLYAAGGGNLGVTLTQATVNGINVKQQVYDAIANAGGHNLDSLQIGYNVERVYSCSAGNDSFLVIEGHQ